LVRVARPAQPPAEHARHRRIVVDDQQSHGQRIGRSGHSPGGLGRFVVRAVVTAHAGAADLRNGPALGGAVLTVRLPAVS
jgi:signal transduction histidine kinase